jgi:hypothetical protein
MEFEIFIAVVYASSQVYTHLFAMSQCLPPYLHSLDTLIHHRLSLSWVDVPGCVKAAAIPVCEKVVRWNICHMELESFHALVWCLFYLAAVIDCSTHMPAMETPQQHHGKSIPSATSSPSSSPRSAPASRSSCPSAP